MKLIYGRMISDFVASSKIKIIEIGLTVPRRMLKITGYNFQIDSQRVERFPERIELHSWHHGNKQK